MVGSLAGLSLAWFLFWGPRLNTGVNFWWAATDLQIHGLLIPAFLAVLLASPRYRRVAARWLRPRVFIPVTALLLLAVHRISQSVRIPLVNIVFPLTVASVFLHPSSLSCRILEAAPLRYIGRLSYGLYLWQELFFMKVSFAALSLPAACSLHWFREGAANES